MFFSTASMFPTGHLSWSIVGESKENVAEMKCTLTLPLLEKCRENDQCGENYIWIEAGGIM